MHRLTAALKLLFVGIVAGLFFTATIPQSQAQVSLSIGVAPVCPYGYYDYSPYNCAPYGYYGPNWFNGGVFVGAGPWFHGPANFRGRVNNRFDPHHGYHGPMPSRGEHADARHNYQHMNFHGNENRAQHNRGNDGHGNDQHHR